MAPFSKGKKKMFNHKGRGGRRPAPFHQVASLPPHTISVRGGIATENLLPGKTVYDEDLLKVGGLEYRTWNPMKSKLAAALLKGVQVYLSEDSLVLYLGVSSGTTASHVSDICRKGMIFGVDPAPRVMRDFYILSQARDNLAPIFAGAELPMKYSGLVPKVDLVYQDVAQRDQAEIFLKNCRAFLKKGGHGLLMVKARSVDVRKTPEAVFGEVRKKLEAAGAKIVASARLEPFEKDHIAYYCAFPK